MKNKQKVIIIIAVVSLLLIVVGISYAYFSAQITGNESGTTITTSAGTLNVVFDGGSNITASNVYPQDNAVATKTFTVTGTNTTTLAMPYTLYFVMDSNTLSTGALKYTLISTNTSSNGTVVPSIITQSNIATGSSTITLGSGYFDNGTNSVHTYVLNVYFPNTASDQNADQGKSFTAHVKIESEPTGVPDGWNESTSGTMLYAMKTANSLTTSLTTPGQDIGTVALNYTDPGIGSSPYTRTLTSTYWNYYFSYGTGYTFNESTGLYTLTGVTVGKYSDIYTNLVGKYICTLLPVASSSGSATSSSSVFQVNTTEYTASTSGSFTYYRASRITNYSTGELASTVDDYGMSYYYRGAVEDNYVVFANMCWRIVRVTGSGAIKMTLYNYNASSVSNPCDSAYDSTNAAFARYSGDTYTTPYNTRVVDNSYLGFMYGDYSNYSATELGSSDARYLDVTAYTYYSNYTYDNATNTFNLSGSSISGSWSSIYSDILSTYPYTCLDTTKPSNCTDLYHVTGGTSSTDAYLRAILGTASSYATGFANVNKSTVLTNLETWYNSKLSSYSQYLSDVVWCNDKSLSSGSGYGINQTYYGAYQRLFDPSTASPSLICPNDANGGSLSKYTVSDVQYGNGDLDYPIGLLTADEVAYAGSIRSISTDTLEYLYKNASSTSWVLMTPLDYTLSQVSFAFRSPVLTANSSGSITGIVATSSTSAFGLRPAIALVSSTTVTGTGTSSDPYVVTGY